MQYRQYSRVSEKDIKTSLRLSLKGAVNDLQEAAEDALRVTTPNHRWSQDEKKAILGQIEKIDKNSSFLKMLLTDG